VKVLKTCIAIYLYLKDACMKSKKPFVKYWPDFNAYFGLNKKNRLVLTYDMFDSSLPLCFIGLLRPMIFKEFGQK